MADFFDDQPPQDITEIDPAAEFLAQQQNEIAGLESDILGGADLGGEPTGFLDDNFEAPPQDVDSNPALVNGFDGAEGNGFDGAGGNGDAQAQERMDPSQAYAAIAAADARLEQLRVEPEQIRIWREENTKLLAEKDRESERRQQEWLAQARKELEDWDRNRQEQLEKTKDSNRIAEEQFIKERDQANPGSEWERVSKLCDFNPKVSKGSKDVGRMRSSLLHLKQNPRAVAVVEVNGN